MKQSKKLLLLIPIIIFLFFNSSPAQNIWPLEKCITYAFENNIGIKQQMISTEIYDNNLMQSKVDLLPSLNAGANQGLSFGRSLDLTTYDYVDEKISTTSLNMVSSVTLFSGLQKLNTIQQNEFNLLASLQELEKVKNDIAIRIATDYLQILFNRELLAVAKNQHEITLLKVEHTAKLVEAGSLARGSLFEIQAQAASEELNVVSAENILR